MPLRPAARAPGSPWPCRAAGTTAPARRRTSIDRSEDSHAVDVTITAPITVSRIGVAVLLLAPKMPEAFSPARIRAPTGEKAAGKVGCEQPDRMGTVQDHQHRGDRGRARD